MKRSIRLLSIQNEGKQNSSLVTIMPFVLHRFLYWCDRGPRARISRSLLNGENMTYLVTTLIIRPESITIDFLTDDVYWSDTVRDTVEVMSWDGRNRRTVTRNIPKGISLLIANNDLYIMDRAFSSVAKKPISSFDFDRTLILSLDHAYQ